MSKIMPRNQTGFVLVATVWMTAIILILAGIFNLFAERQLELAIEMKDRLQYELDKVSTEQTLLYMFSTNRFTVAGLLAEEVVEADEDSGTFTIFLDDEPVSSAAVGGEIRLDGTIYGGTGGALFSVTDFTGLLALNSESNYHLAHMMEEFEPDLLKRQELMNRLADYRDKDDLIRLNGAEKYDYLKANLTPPTNDVLRSPVEILKVMGWKDWLERHPGFDINRWCSTSRQSAINPNTIPEALFHRLPGMTEEISNRLLGVRVESPFRSMEDFIKKSNGFLSLRGDYFRFFPSGQVRIQFFSAENRKLSTIAVKFTPYSLSDPWLIEYRYESERDFEISGKVNSTKSRYFPEELFSNESESLFSSG